MERAVIPIDLLFIDCTGNIRSKNRTRLIEESSDQSGYNQLVKKAVLWLRTYEYVHRRYSSNGNRYIVSYGVRFSTLREMGSIENALRIVKDDFARKRILVINTVPCVPYDPHEELYLPVRHHAEIQELVNIKLNDWKCKLLVSPVNAQPIATSSSPIPTPPIPNAGIGITTDTHMMTTEEDEDQTFISSQPVRLTSRTSRKRVPKIKIKLLARDTPEIPELLAPIKDKPTSRITSLMDSFDPMVDYHTGLHDELQRLRTRFLPSSSPLPSNGGVSAVYGLVEKFADKKTRFIELHQQWRMSQLEEQIGDTIPPPSKRRKTDNLSYQQAREMNLLGLPPYVYFEKEVQLEVYLAFEWSTERNVLGPGCVTLSEDDWNAIRDWEKVCNREMQYDSQARYLICEFGCYKKTQLEDYFYSLFRAIKYQKAYADAGTINILPELEKLPVDSRPRIWLRMQDATIDWLNSDEWRVKLRIERDGKLQESVIDVMGLGYINTKKKATAEVIHSSYLSKNNSTRFSISVDSLHPREEVVVADRVFMIYTRSPTSMDIACSWGYGGPAPLAIGV